EVILSRLGGAGSRPISAKLSASFRLEIKPYRLCRAFQAAASRLVSMLSALKPENSLLANALLLDEFLPSQIAAHSSRRQMALCHLASGWKLAPSAVSSSCEKYRWQVFVWMDRYLDTTRKGPQYLVRPEIAA